MADTRIRFGTGQRPDGLLTEIAHDNARQIVADNRARGLRRDAVHLREFCDELTMWHDKVFAHRAADREARYKELAPFIRMLCAKVTEAKGQGQIGPGFEEMFAHVVNAIKNPETLKDAQRFMAAFMGFYQAEEQK